MADSDVKIKISTEADVSGADEAEQRLRKLKDEEKRTQPTPRPEPKPKPEDPKPARPSTDVPPKPVTTAQPSWPKKDGEYRLATEANPRGDQSTAAPTRERATAEKEVTREVRAQGDELEETKKRIKDLYRSAAAYEANGMDTAAASARADARSLERDVARFTKEKAAEENRATREMREQDALRKAGITTMRQIGNIGVGALVGEIIPSVIDQIAAGETLSNRRAATESRNTRQASILNSVRGTSGQVASEAWSAEDNVAQLRRERPQLQSDQKFNTARAIGEGAGWGAGVGAVVGSVVPVLGTAVGAGIGAALGAAVKGIPAYLQGRNALKQSEQEEQQEEKRGKNLTAMASDKFLKEEGGLQLGALRGRSKRSLEGHREALVNEMAEQWLNTYRDVYNRTKGNDAIASEIAGLTVKNRVIDTQAAAGAGLVDARSGGGEIAAAARWATGSFPGMSELATQINALHATVQQGNQDGQIVNQAK